MEALSSGLLIDKLYKIRIDLVDNTSFDFYTENISLELADNYARTFLAKIGDEFINKIKGFGTSKVTQIN